MRACGCTIVCISESEQRFEESIVRCVQEFHAAMRTNKDGVL
jgi:hypothetical protein